MLVNHGLAGSAGAFITSLASPHTMRWVQGLSFIAMAIWTLIPDKFEEGDAKLARLGLFGTALAAFFIAEMGDKTQVATVALAAQYNAILSVVVGIW
jgi:putative Ca2+/H+ antiporter (TMEM165/GDT1 family)